MHSTCAFVGANTSIMFFHKMDVLTKIFEVETSYYYNLYCDNMKFSTSSVTFKFVGFSLYHIEYRVFVAQFTKPLLAKVSCSQVVTLIHFYSNVMCDVACFKIIMGQLMGHRLHGHMTPERDDALKGLGLLSRQGVGSYVYTCGCGIACLSERLLSVFYQFYGKSIYIRCC